MSLEWIALLPVLLGSDPLPRTLAESEAAAEERPLPEWTRLETPRLFWTGQEPAPKADPVPPAEHPLRSRGSHASFGAFFETHGSLEAWHENVWRDYLTAPPVLIPLGLAAAAGVASIYDKRLQKCLKDSLGDNAWIGDAAMSVLLAGSLATAFFAPADGRSSWDVLAEQLEAFALTAALTFGLKAAFPRGRPGGSGDDSFPSGHTSAAFVGASLIDQNVDAWYWEASAYGLASLAGYSRIEADRHYLSDVLAGAAIGVFSAGVMEALHWGTGRGGTGIAGAKLEVEYFDRGGSLGLAFKF